jgi:acetyl-CoA carboxylase/biotin carboxylase 1
VWFQEQLAQPELAAADRQKLEAALKKRQEQIKPLYHQVAVHFADLHDTPWRMLDKGCISVSGPAFSAKKRLPRLEPC